MKLLLILSSLLLLPHASFARCMATEPMDFKWTGTFKVLTVPRNLRTTNPLWLQTGGDRKFGGCILSLKTLKAYESNEPKDKPVDVYVFGKPCDSKVEDTIEATIASNCCDVIGDTEHYEFQACALNSRRMLEFRVRNSQSGKLQRLTSDSKFKTGPEVDIKTYEKDWETYLQAIKRHEPKLCAAVVDKDVASECRDKSERRNQKQ